MVQQEKQLKLEQISKHDFFFEVPLYKFVPNSQMEENIFIGDVDAFSSKNSSETTYSINKEPIDIWNVWDDVNKQSVKNGFYFITLVCKRKNNDELRFVVFQDNAIVVKIGQFPSLADLQFSEIGKKYDKVLPAEDLRNLKKAIGLVANGIGAGSFVYLRRIFENLIFETYKNNVSSLSINESDFKTKKMEEKIIILKTYLPSQLVEMKSIYSILSKGVHELEEEDCLKYFKPLKLSIELILDQKIEDKIKRDRDSLVKKQLQDIHQQIAGINKE